ncbi:MAG: DNA translocase FtsK [Chitinophagaceae bacterium]|nr:MAG: DNA translocase FtsK [Chitinophagaceae bacterium]
MGKTSKAGQAKTAQKKSGKTSNADGNVKKGTILKVSGLLLLLISLFLFISFTSYLFTYKVDNSEVFNNPWNYLFSINESEELHFESPSNIMGRVGAVTAHIFIYNGFGIASYGWVYLFFILGINLIFRKSIFKFLKNLKYTFLAVIWLSVTLSFLFGNMKFPFGGVFGNSLALRGADGLNSGWLIEFSGSIGTALIILFSLVIFLTVLYNFNFENLLKLSFWKGVITDKRVNEKDESFTQADDFNEQKYEVDNAGIEEDEDFVEKTTDIKEEIEDDFEIEFTQETKAEEPKTEKPKEDEKEEDLDLQIEKVSEEKEADPGSIESTYDPTAELSDFKFPTLDLLIEYSEEGVQIDEEELHKNKRQIVETLKNYNIEISKIKATIGPTVTLYEIIPAPGVRISKIKNLEDDIALSLAALGIRIIAPIPGKGTIGIEVPNVNKRTVGMRSLLASEKFQHSKMSLPMALGKNIANEIFIADLATMPHLLMAGATGQGKSVGLNAILVSLLYKKHPSELKFVLVDPKKVELTLFRQIEQHYLAQLPGAGEPIITDTKEVIYTLRALCQEMDDRYELLKIAAVRNIKEYNAKFLARRLNPQNGHKYMPFIVLVIDEFADLMMTAGKEIETPIARLAQLARAIGIHLIIATQRPSVNIITGTIKANFPARIAFKVSSKVDSRTILDGGGADQLIGRGDMLLSIGGDMIRLQCGFVDTPEVENVTSFIGDQRGFPEPYLLPEVEMDDTDETGDTDSGPRDARFEEAARLIVQLQQGSTSLIQRRLGVGYARAGKLIDQMAAVGIVGPHKGSKAREVLIKDEMELEQFLNNLN